MHPKSEAGALCLAFLFNVVTSHARMFLPANIHPRYPTMTRCSSACCVGAVDYLDPGRDAATTEEERLRRYHTAYAQRACWMINVVCLTFGLCTWPDDACMKRLKAQKNGISGMPAFRVGECVYIDGEALHKVSPSFLLAGGFKRMMASANMLYDQLHQCHDVKGLYKSYVEFVDYVTQRTRAAVLVEASEALRERGASGTDHAHTRDATCLHAAMDHARWMVKYCRLKHRVTGPTASEEYGEPS